MNQEVEHRRRIRILLADDHRLMLEGIERALEASGDFEILGGAHSGPEVLPLVRRTSPDVVLLDIRMPGMDGLTCIDLIRKQHPDVKVVVMSAFSDPTQIDAALKRGACGYILKTINPLDLPSALRQAVDGTVFHAIGFPEQTEETLARAVGLTEREIGILKAVARGLSNQAIAKELWVTEQTVKFHLTNIYRKLDVANRTEAAHYAHQHGFVTAAAETSE
jgi:NarL family two-component system response regulator LiaR